MHFDKQECPYQFSIEETADGYAIHVKGDKQVLKAKLEAMEAYKNFREKAKAAGITGHHGHHAHRHGHHGFLSLIHKHLQAAHQGKHKCSKEQAE